MDTDTYTAGQAANITSAEHTGGKKSNIPTWVHSTDGPVLLLLSICAVLKSCCTKVSRQYGSLQKLSGLWHSSHLRHSSLSISFSPDISSLSGHPHQDIQELEICSPPAADGVWVSCHYTHIHSTFTLLSTILSSKLSRLMIFAIADLQVPLSFCFDFMAPAAANSLICLLIISLVLCKLRKFHPEKIRIGFRNKT